MSTEVPIHDKHRKVGRTRTERRIARFLQGLGKLVEERDAWANDIHSGRAVEPYYTPSELLTVYRFIVSVDDLRISHIRDRLLGFVDNANLPHPPPVDLQKAPLVQGSAK